MLKKSDSWNLTVCFWPKATEAGVKPCEVLRFQFEEWTPNFYISHTINFKNPPSREDFLHVVNGTYWMLNNWKDTLLPLIASGTWPMIYRDWEKGAHADILDAQGRVVGRLDVSREDVWENANYHTAPIDSDDRAAVLRGLKGDARSAAENAFYGSPVKNRVREKLSKQEFFTTEDVRRELRSALVELGLMKARKPAKRKPVAELQAA